MKKKQKSMDVVFEEVAGALPHFISRLRVDRSWVWIAGTEKIPKQDREKLKSIGFRFKRGDPHDLGNGEGSHWAHACSKPTFPRRNAGGSTGAKATRQPQKTDEETDEWAQAFAALGL